MKAAAALAARLDASRARRGVLVCVSCGVRHEGAAWAPGPGWHDFAEAPSPSPTWCRAHGAMDQCPEHCPTCRGYFHRGRCAFPVSAARDGGGAMNGATLAMPCPLHPGAATLRHSPDGPGLCAACVEELRR